MRARPLRWTALAVAALSAACGTSACQGSTVAPSVLGGTLSVFAADSFTESFHALGASFRRANPGLTVQFNFAATPTLVAQIEQGAPADLFAAADETNMQQLQSARFTSGALKVFAHDELEIVVAPGNPKHIQDLSDLARADVTYIVAAPTIPAGAYAAEALALANVTATPRSLEADVKSVISKVELGEADAGIVYATDVIAAGDKVKGVPIADSDNIVATYSISAVKGAKNPRAAQAFIAYAISVAGQAVLQPFGFLPA